MNLNVDVSPWIGIFSAIWLLLYLLGRWQFSRVTKGTAALVLEQGRLAQRSPHHPTVEDVYAKVQPAWEVMVKQKAWFVPHKSELFPLPATLDIVRKRLNFTPVWVGAYLQVNGIELPAGSEMKAEIARIAAQAEVQKKRSKF